MNSNIDRLRIFACAISTSAALSGCVSEMAVDGYTVDALTKTNTSIEYGDMQLPPPFNLDGGDYGTLPGGLTFAKASEPNNKRGRDDFAHFLIERSNTLCERHRAGIAAVSSSVNFGLTELATGLNTAGTLVVGEQAAKILTGIAGAVNASRDAFNENIYQNQLMPAILESIKNSRENKYKEIVASLSKSTDEYPASALLVDVNDYHQRCSFVEGMSTLAAAAKEVKVTDAEREQKVQELKKQLSDLNATSVSGTQQKAGIQAAGKVITDQIQQLKREQAVKTADPSD